MQVLIKLFTPEYYDAATHAVICVTPGLIEFLAEAMRLADRLHKENNCFLGLEYWDYTPEFIDFACPEKLGMTEEEFEQEIETGCIVFPDADAPTISALAQTIPMTTVSLFVSDDDFHWIGYDKYVGASGRCETYSFKRADLEEWAEALKVAIKTKD